MNRHIPLTVLVLGLAVGTGDIAFSGHAQQQTAAEIIAAKIRNQGYTCGKAESAERDVKASKPHLSVWILRCDNARYRVRVIPSMADEVERLD